LKKLCAEQSEHYNQFSLSSIKKMEVE